MTDLRFLDTIFAGGTIGAFVAAMRCAHGGQRCLIVDNAIVSGSSALESRSMNFERIDHRLCNHVAEAKTWWKKHSKQIGYVRRGAYTIHETDILTADDRNRTISGRSSDLGITSIPATLLNSKNLGLDISHARSCSYCPSNGDVSADMLYFHLREEAHKSGITVARQPIADISGLPGAFEVLVGDTVFHARCLVLTSDSQIEQLLKYIQVPLHLLRRKRSTVISEPVDFTLDKIIGIDTHSIEIRQTNTRNIVVTGEIPCDEASIHDLPRSHDTTAKIVDTALRIFPPMKSRQVIRLWNEIRYDTVDGMPLIGNVPDVAGAFMMLTGCCSTILEPYFGTLAADMVLGAQQPIERFDPGRTLLDSDINGQPATS